jgi:hypothetical protein
VGHGGAELRPHQTVAQRQQRADQPAQHRLRAVHGAEDERYGDERAHAHHVDHVERGGFFQAQPADELSCWPEEACEEKPWLNRNHATKLKPQRPRRRKKGRAGASPLPSSCAAASCCGRGRKSGPRPHSACQAEGETSRLMRANSSGWTKRAMGGGARGFRYCPREMSTSARRSQCFRFRQFRQAEHDAALRWQWGFIRFARRRARAGVDPHPYWR